MSATFEAEIGDIDASSIYSGPSFQPLTGANLADRYINMERVGDVFRSAVEYHRLREVLIRHIYDLRQRNARLLESSV